MTDPLATLPRLLARLGVSLPTERGTTRDDYRIGWRDERAECLAAIRAMMAEGGRILIARDAAIATEREACAKVCDAIAASKWAAGIAAIGAKSCAAAIRARGESEQPGSTRDV